MTKSAENCGFGYITEEIINGKLHFLFCEFQEQLLVAASM